jgi:release factor glutamine methyltransferase
MQNYLEYIVKSLQGIYSGPELRSMSRILIEEVSGMQAALFLSDKSKQLNEQQEQRLEDILARLKKSEPLQYVLGWTEFYGIPFVVDSRVLIPRPETEELVDWIAGDNDSGQIRLLDIGTGSGCIAVSLAKLLPQALVEAWDVSPDALAVACHNAKENGVYVLFREVDVLVQQVADVNQKFNILVSNPPYVMNSEKKQMHGNVLDHEPHLALFVEDSDPLLFYRRIAELGTSLLVVGGTLYFEINAAKGHDMVEMLQKMGYVDVRLKQDLSGKDRMIRAKWVDG